MATRRKSTKARAGRKAAARPGRNRRAGTRSRGRRTGAREARPVEAGREVRRERERSPTEPPGRRPDGPPALRLAEPPAVGEAGPGAPGAEADRRAAERDREAAELARRIEATVGAASDTLRTGPASAAEQLRIHREEMEEAARREASRDLPGVVDLGLELAGGALRLARSMATAPFRIGFAVLRRGFLRG